MSRPTRIQYEHAFYHVMNRGRGRQRIFHSAKYYAEFLKTLEESHARFDARIHAYCLMGNHYHLLVETPRANLDRVMRHVNGVYTQRYNWLKGTDGPLFRGRYKAILVDEDAYLLEVGRYIHRNPLEVKGASSNVLKQFKRSSYLAYQNQEQAPEWLDRERTYRMLGHRNRYAAYKAFVERGNDEETEEFYGKGNVSSIMGDESFRKSIQEDKMNLQVSTELPQALSQRPEQSAIVEAVAKVFKTSEAKIVEKRSGRQAVNVARQMAIYCSQQLGDHSLKEIALHYNLTNAGSVSPAIAAIKSRMRNRELRREYSKVERLLGITK